MTSTLQYAVVGTGTVGTVLAQRFSDHHVPALFANTRGPETIDVTELSASITPATLDTALDADVIILAIPFLLRTAEPVLADEGDCGEHQEPYPEALRIPVARLGT